MPWDFAFDLQIPSSEDAEGATQQSFITVPGSMLANMIDGSPNSHKSRNIVFCECAMTNMTNAQFFLGGLSMLIIFL
jgi:hypothetical protein